MAEVASTVERLGACGYRWRSSKHFITFTIGIAVFTGMCPMTTPYRVLSMSLITSCRRFKRGFAVWLYLGRGLQAIASSTAWVVGFATLTDAAGPESQG